MRVRLLPYPMRVKRWHHEMLALYVLFYSGCSTWRADRDANKCVKNTDRVEFADGAMDGSVTLT